MFYSNLTNKRKVIKTYTSKQIYRLRNFFSIPNLVYWAISEVGYQETLTVLVLQIIKFASRKNKRVNFRSMYANYGTCVVSKKVFNTRYSTEVSVLNA